VKPSAREEEMTGKRLTQVAERSINIEAAEDSESDD
jgi:hypothetical protein